MHWALSFSAALRHFRFSSFGIVAFCVECGAVRPLSYFTVPIHIGVSAWMNEGRIARPWHTRGLYNLSMLS